MHSRRPAALILGLALLCGGCAAKSRDVVSYPLPEGSYRVVGLLGAQPVDGRLVVTGDQVVFDSNRGQCHRFLNQDANRERLLRDRSMGLACTGDGGPIGGLRVGLSWDREGTVRASGAISITKLVRKRGPCIRWSSDAARRCLEYDYEDVEQTEWVSGRLTVFREG